MTPDFEIRERKSGIMFWGYLIKSDELLIERPETGKVERWVKQ